MANEITVTEKQPQHMAVKAALTQEDFVKALRSVLPRHISPDRIIRTALAAMQSQPNVFQCTPRSIMLSLMRAAAMGLEPDGGMLGQGYLVPFWNSRQRCHECVFVPGYRGLIKLARNSGEILDVSAEVVRGADHFKYSLGLEPTLEHVRHDEAKESELRYVYAIARFRGGEKKFVVLNRLEVERIKETSASRNQQGEIVGPWKDWESEMWKKTAVRRLCKLLPLSVEQQSMIQTAELPEATSYADMSLLPGFLPTAAITDQCDAHVSVVVEPVVESDGTGDPFEQYQADLAAAEAVKDCQAIYDRWFGPDSTVEFSAEQNQLATQLRDKRSDAIRATRGPRSNRKDSNP